MTRSNSLEQCLRANHTLDEAVKFTKPRKINKKTVRYFYIVHKKFKNPLGELYAGATSTFLLAHYNNFFYCFDCNAMITASKK